MHAQPDETPGPSRRRLVFLSVEILILALVVVVAIVQLRRPGEAPGVSARVSASPTTSSTSFDLCPPPCTPPQGRSVTITVPAGFEVASGFQPKPALDPSYDGRYIVSTSASSAPARDALEVIGVVTYARPSGVDVSTNEARLAAVSQFNVTTAKQITSGAAAATIAGLPAVTEQSKPVFSGSVGSFTYTVETTYVFLSESIVSVDCQYLDNAATFKPACQSLLASLKPVT